MEAPVKELTDHLGLIVVIAVGLWWVFTRVRSTYTLFREFVGHELEERLPALLKRELQNGLGDLVENRVRKVVDQHARDENERMEREFRDLRAAIGDRRRRRV